MPDSAIYGVSYYGEDYYGDPNAWPYDANLIGFPRDYDKAALSWRPPTGTWTTLLLVRSSYGNPTTPSDGTTLFTDAAAGARISYIDTDLKSGKFYYYTLFVEESDGTPHIVGKVTVLITTDYATGDLLWERLPGFYREADTDIGAEQVNGFTDGPLNRFLHLFGYEFDEILTSAHSLLSLSDVSNVSGAVLETFAESLGSPYEPELGQQVTRSMLKNHVHLAKIKGTKPGIEGIVSAYTTFGATLSIGKNKMLDYNQSNFRESISTWLSLQNCTLAWTAAASLPHAAPVDNAGALKITAGNAGTDAIAGCGSFAGISLIPVLGGRNYVVSGYTLAASTTRNRKLRVTWIAADGSTVSTSTGSATADSSSVWTRISVAALAPDTAVWARVDEITTTPANTEIHYLTGVQIEIALAASTFESARRLNIYLDPTRANLVTNPSFEDGTTGWSGVDATISQTD